MLVSYRAVMASVMEWVRSLGNEGALINAQRACEERRRDHAALEVAIARLSPRRAVVTPIPERQHATA
jgi:hypothetical protein